MTWPIDPGSPWRGFDPNTFDVDVPEFEFPESRSSTAVCFAILSPEDAAQINAIANLAHSGLHKEAERVRGAVGYAGFGGD